MKKERLFVMREFVLLLIRKMSPDGLFEDAVYSKSWFLFVSKLGY